MQNSARGVVWPRLRPHEQGVLPVPKLLPDGRRAVHHPHLCKVRNGVQGVSFVGQWEKRRGQTVLESSKGKPQRGSKAWPRIVARKEDADLGFWALTRQKDVDTVGGVCQDLSNCSDFQRLFANGIVWGI